MPAEAVAQYDYGWLLPARVRQAEVSAAFRSIGAMFVGIDASGKFSMGGGFEPSTLAGAVVGDGACAQIADWTSEALVRWGLDGALAELHAKEMSWDARLEVCEMLAGRGDVRFAVVLTDQLLLGSAAAVNSHRRRQLEKITAGGQPHTDEGRQRLATVAKLLADDRFKDSDYVYAVIIPLVACGALQQALCFFRRDEWRDEMTTIRLVADEEAPKTARYCASSLFPVLGGDPRFSLTLPANWREEPVHPLLAKALHSDGDGLRPQALLGEIEWVASKDQVAVQLADMAAWVVRRAVSRPEERVAQECFDLLRPSLEGEKGMTFGVWSPRPLTADDTVLYAHLQQGTQPEWWLTRVGAVAR